MVKPRTRFDENAEMLFCAVSRSDKQRHLITPNSLPCTPWRYPVQPDYQQSSPRSEDTESECYEPSMDSTYNQQRERRKSSSQFHDGYSAPVRDSLTVKTKALMYTELKDEIRIVLIGKTGVGKSATGNTILGKNVFRSKTSSASVTHKCESGQARRFGKDVLVVDTPGIYDTGLTMEQTKDEVSRMVNMSVPGPHAILLVLAIRDRFTEEEPLTTEHLSDLFGEAIYQYIIVLFTGRDNLGRDPAYLSRYIHKSPKALRVLLTKCNNRCIAFDIRASSTYRKSKVKKLLDLIDKNIERNRGSFFTNGMYEAAVTVFGHRRLEMKRKVENENQSRKENLQREIDAKYSWRLVKLEKENRRLKNQQRSLNEKAEKELSELKSSITKNERTMNEREEEYHKDLRYIKDQLMGADARLKEQRFHHEKNMLLNYISTVNINEERR